MIEVREAPAVAGLARPLVAAASVDGVVAALPPTVREEAALTLWRVVDGPRDGVSLLAPLVGVRNGFSQVPSSLLLEAPR